MSASEPTVTVPPAGQPATGGVPLTVSRTVAVHAGLQPRLTIAIDGTSVFADASANVSVKPAVARVRRRHGAREARDRVDRRRHVRVRDREAAVPEDGRVVAADLDLERVAGFAALKPVSVTCCCSLPPWSAAAIPAVVLFWPRVIGDRVGAVVVQRVRVAVRRVPDERHRLHLGDSLERRLDRRGGEARAVRDRRRDVAAPVQAERVVRAAVVRLLDRGEAAAAAEVDELDARHVDARPTRRCT